jgi:hypothetical protein
MLEVEIGPETVTYALREGERLVIRHEKEEIPLTREQPQAVRPSAGGEETRADPDQASLRRTGGLATG